VPVINCHLPVRIQVLKRAEQPYSLLMQFGLLDPLRARAQDWSHIALYSEHDVALAVVANPIKQKTVKSIARMIPPCG
jgi:hypothetical protein